MKTSTQFKKNLLAGLIGASIMSLAVAPSFVMAASSDANLRGHAPPNALVTARNIATGSTRVTKANGEGSYALVGLPPGTYTVDAGPGTTQTVTLSVASTATLNLTAAAATSTRSEERRVGKERRSRGSPDQR